MIKIKVNSQRMSKTLNKLNTYANEELGKASENILRRIVTGKGSEDLSDDLGLYGQALMHAPTPQKIENDVRKLKLAYMKEGGSKKLVPLNKANKAKILRDRIKAIGFTARTLLFDWQEAKNSRSSAIQGQLDRDHKIRITTSGNKAVANFLSKSKGLLKINKKKNVVRKEVEKAKNDALSYLQQILKTDVRKLLNK